MLKEVQQNNGWEAKYQAAIRDFESQEGAWLEIEALLRKTIRRLSLVGRGLDARLDKQLALIQNLSREKRDEKLAQALEKLSKILASLNNPKANGKQRRSDPIMLMLELLQGIHFDTAQRKQLKSICSNLLKSVANGHNREVIRSYIVKLSSLINENFDNLKNADNSAEVVFELIALLDLDQPRNDQFQQRFSETRKFRRQELKELAKLINQQLDTGVIDASIDSVMTTLLERLAIVQGANGSAQEIQARVHESDDDEQWTEALNDIVASVSGTLKKLDEEKRELEQFIVKVTAQLGDITLTITADHEDHQSDHEDTQSLHDFVEEGMTLIQKDFQSSNDLSHIKSAISTNIDSIRGGVDEFVSRINERHVATEQRNQKLSAQLSQMEEETQELQLKLIENREKLLYDALTGSHSRLAYDEQIQQEIARWGRYQTPFSYAIIDIDHFKRINDAFGHNAGDKALKLVAKIMQKNIRKSDSVFRIGGEEFVLILTNTDINQADKLIAKLRKAISDSSIHFKQERVQLTVSAGLTETRYQDDAESIFERADKALYQAKNSGRNCQFIAD